MSKILYNRAAKTFMDAIGQGFDEHGAYDKVEKKHGKVLADAVWAEAQAEMKSIKKRNPRSLVGLHVRNQRRVYGTIIDERPTYVVVKFNDNTQDRFQKSRIKGI